jgi:2-C-methyl-D-erythritol 4-phosphate cytidylyltransferase
MYVSAIIVAAGKSKRLGGKVSKAVLKLNSKPIIAYSLDVLNEHHKVNEIIVVGNRANTKSLRDIIKRNKIRKVRNIILGGAERQDSVYNGLRAISPKADFILIHDAARPFITKGLVSLVIEEAQRSKAAIVGVPVKSTIKEVRSQRPKSKTGLIVQRTLDRSNLWEIQTPQVFSRKIILKAYKDFGRLKATDDAMLVEKAGKKVKMVLGAHQNIKITTPEDLIIAKGIAKLWKPA